MILVKLIQTILQLRVLSLQPRYRVFPKLLFIVMALMQSLNYPGDDLLVKGETLQQIGKALLQHFLPRVRFGALSLVTRAVVIDIPAFLSLRYERTPAMPTIDKSGIGKLMLHHLLFSRVPPLQYFLHTFKEALRNQRFMIPVISLTAPVKITRIDPLAE